MTLRLSPEDFAFLIYLIGKAQHQLKTEHEFKRVWQAQALKQKIKGYIEVKNYEDY
ncbi:hypothetical protein JW930_00235 [Candidatus Woesearchaeota archaeon]|nr:hypothetical protein [Candidatus Woesearchaeota archaeon]